MMQWAPQIGLAMFVAMVLFMALRVPIAASMFIPGLAGYWLMTDTATSLNFLKGSAVARLTVYELAKAMAIRAAPVVKRFLKFINVSWLWW